MINFNPNLNTNEETNSNNTNYNLNNNINLSNINKETKSYIDTNTNTNITPTEANQIHPQLGFNELDQEQISIIKDLNYLKDINKNNIKYTANNTANNNNNLFTASNISNNYNIKYNNNFYKTISYPNNILSPQTVLSFSTKRQNNITEANHEKAGIDNTHIKLGNISNKLNTSKKFDYYKKDFFVLKRKYNALKGKYNMEKKKAEGINLKLYYESHKNDELINKLKNKIKNLVIQIKSNVNTFDTLKKELENKNNEIEKKNSILEKQNEIIKGLINELKNKEQNFNFNSYNSNSYNQDNDENMSQSINITSINSANDLIKDKI